MNKVKLKEICRLINGRAYKQQELLDNGKYPVLRVGNFFSDKDYYYSDLELDEDKYCDNGDLLFAWSASFGPKIWNGGKVIYHYHIWKMELSERVDRDYLYYYLFHLSERIKSEGHGGIMIHTTKAEMEEREFVLPELTHQKQIAELLSKVATVIEMRKQELQKLDELIKVRFVEMFGSINDGRFEMKTLPEIASKDKNSIKRGPFGGALKKDDFVEEGYLVYEQRHAIHNDFEYAKYYITQEKYEDMIGFKVIPGDLIISCSGVTLGCIAEVPEGAKEGIINQALLKLSLNQKIMMNTFFIQQFRGEEIQEILFGFSRGSGIPNMPSMSEVKAVKFICPPLALQKQYCDFVRQVDKSKVAVQAALDKTQLLFDSLMQEYFG